MYGTRLRTMSDYQQRPPLSKRLTVSKGETPHPSAKPMKHSASYEGKPIHDAVRVTTERFVGSKRTHINGVAVDKEDE